MLGSPLAHLIYQRRAACGNAITALDRSAATVAVLAKACNGRADTLIGKSAARRRYHMAETQDEW
jgi:hypothetical protein